VEKDTHKKIAILPFNHVQAFADVETGEIFVGQDFVTSNVEENIKHEFAHIISGDPDHGNKFRKQLELYNGSLSENEDLFKIIRKRIGIASNIAANIGNISGIQNILTDYHLLQSYRKFAQKVLGTEGHWEVINEGTSNVQGDSLSAKDQLIRLYPTPKGAFPVVVLYMPVVDHFRSPQARMITYELMEAEVMIAVGMARRKIQGLPTPDGGSVTYDGAELVQEGQKAKEEIIDKAIKLGEPLGVYLWSWLVPLLLFCLI
jgi:hypothetical protein